MFLGWEKSVLAERPRKSVQAMEMAHGDIDGDGDIDVAGISRYEGKVFWYAND